MSLKLDFNHWKTYDIRDKVRQITGHNTPNGFWYVCSRFNPKHIHPMFLAILIVKIKRTTGEIIC
jgi:hypothetical protein